MPSDDGHWGAVAMATGGLPFQGAAVLLPRYELRWEEYEVARDVGRDSAVCLSLLNP
jgi:hypothetical protein